MGAEKSAVLVLGSSNVDVVVRVESLPRPGETVLGKGRREHWGGKGANQALAARRAGAEVRFVTMLGGDPAGDAYLRRLTESGLSPEGVLRCDSPTGAALILVDDEGENQIAVVPGANALLTPGRMRREPGLLDFGAVVLAQLEVPASSVAAAFRAGRRRGARNVLNPAPAAGGSPKELFRLADVLAPNETEAAELAGLDGAPASDVEFLRAARALRALGPSRVVITAGRRGAFLLDGSGACWTRPPRRGEGGGRDRCRGRFLRRAGGQAGGGRGDGRGRSLRRRRGGLLREKARRAGGSALASGDSEDAKHGAPKTDSGRLTSSRNPHRVHGRRRGMGEASPRTIMSPRR